MKVSNAERLITPDLCCPSSKGRRPDCQRSAHSASCGSALNCDPERCKRGTFSVRADSVSLREMVRAPILNSSIRVSWKPMSCTAPPALAIHQPSTHSLRCGLTFGIRSSGPCGAATPQSRSSAHSSCTCILRSLRVHPRSILANCDLAIVSCAPLVRFFTAN